MNKTELLRVAEILETKVKDDQFNLINYKCGTTACAIGWYCILHESDLGLKLNNFDVFSPYLNGLNGLYAVAKHFDISYRDAAFLFFRQHSYYSRQHVIDRIKKFIKE